MPQSSIPAPLYAELTDAQLARKYVELERIEPVTPYAVARFDAVQSEMTRRGLDISDFDGDDVSPDSRDEF